MARNLARIPPIWEDDPRETLEIWNSIIDEINRVFGEVESEVNQQKGNGGTPVFHAPPDLNMNRITDVGRSQLPDDVVTRQELIDLGLLGDPSGRIVFNGEVEFAGSVYVTGPPGDIATGAYVEDSIDQALEENVATSNPGDPLGEEQDDGTNSNTTGTAVLGRDEDGKARFLELTASGLRVDTGNLEALLVILINEIREMKHGSGN